MPIHKTLDEPILEDHVPAIKTDAANCVLVRQDNRSANVRMARKRHLSARRENTHASGARGMVRRQYKRCLSKIELVGDGLHLSVRKAARIGNHRPRRLVFRSGLRLRPLISEAVGTPLGQLSTRVVLYISSKDAELLTILRTQNDKLKFTLNQLVAHLCLCLDCDVLTSEFWRPF